MEACSFGSSSLFRDPIGVAISANGSIPSTLFLPLFFTGLYVETNRFVHGLVKESQIKYART